MPIIKSAKKALRQSIKKRRGNLKRKQAMRLAIKNVTADNLKDAYKAIDKAAKAGIIKKRTASRRKSRVARMVISATKVKS